MKHQDNGSGHQEEYQSICQEEGVLAEEEQLILHSGRQEEQLFPNSDHSDSDCKLFTHSGHKEEQLLLRHAGHQEKWKLPYLGCQVEQFSDHQEK